MKYCDICILPFTRPNLKITKNGCNCSKHHTISHPRDFKKLESEFREIANLAKSKNCAWDCIIPVSGGKDSTWQTVKALEYGLKPLCVTWRTPGRTSLGQRNLDNLINLGVDHIDFSINPKVEKAFTRKAFEKAGIPALPMHYAIFAIPTQLAVQRKIPLILWGENSAYEYGGNDDLASSKYLTHGWLKKYGVNGNTEINDWVSSELTDRDLSMYRYPSQDELALADIHSIFLGMFFPWTPSQAYEFSRKYGFTAANEPVVGSYNYADVDEAFVMSVHHWLKWYKFGFTRTWDNLSIEIREGKISRKAAIEKIAELGDETPMLEIERFCEYTEITVSYFFEIASKFRNSNIWKYDKKNKKFFIEDFIIPSFNWR